MSLDEFERIAEESPEVRDDLRRLRELLAEQEIGAPVLLRRIVDETEIEPARLRYILGQVRNVVEVRTYPVCAVEDVPLPSSTSASPEFWCDLCQRDHSEEQISFEECCIVRCFISRPRHEVRAVANSGSNALTDPEMLTVARVKLWDELPEEKYLLRLRQLGESEQREILSRLDKFGICQLRWEGESPSHERLASFEQWLGPFREQQNDYEGKIKRIEPRPGVTANTGDSEETLPPHVDGTQDPVTPGLLIFQYQFGAAFGAMSTFVDVANVLSRFEARDLERVLMALASRDCAVCEKTKGSWKRKFKGSLVKLLPGKYGVSLRFRPDDVLKVSVAYRREFEELKNAILAADQLKFTPQEGDTVIFDNWRVLHGRLKVGGRRPRAHDRVWVDQLHARWTGRYTLGIRPLAPALLAAIENT